MAEDLEVTFFDDSAAPGTDDPGHKPRRPFLSSQRLRRTSWTWSLNTAGMSSGAHVFSCIWEPQCSRSTTDLLSISGLLQLQKGLGHVLLRRLVLDGKVALIG